MRGTGALVIGWLALTALPGGPADAAAVDRVAPARDAAQRSLASIENRPCPAPGDNGYVGNTDPSQLNAAADGQLAFARQSVGTLDRLAADPQLSPEAREELTALGSWTVARSLGDYAVLRLAQQAAADPRIAPGQPFPTDLSETTGETLARLGTARPLLPAAAALIQRLRQAVTRCSRTMLGAVMTVNRPYVLDAIRDAASPADLNRIDGLYRLRRNGDEVSAALLIAWQDRMRAVTPRVASAPPRPTPDRETSGPSPAQLATVRRFVTAANGQNRSAALAELTDDVQLITPNGRYQGKDQVAQAVASQAAQGSSGALGQPSIRGGSVVAGGRAAGFSVVTTFEFNGAKISRMTVRLA